MQTIVEVACNSVPGFDHAGISTVEKQGTIETEACTATSSCGSMPCSTRCAKARASAVLQGTDAVSVSILDHEQRWPRYVPQALEAGVRSQMAVKLYLDENTLGGISFYSTIPTR